MLIDDYIYTCGLYYSIYRWGLSKSIIYIGDIHLFFWVHAGLVDIACDIADLSIGGHDFPSFHSYIPIDQPVQPDGNS